MSRSSQPLVTIGVPAFNGEAFICRTLRALLAQDYDKIEVIVSDDGSRDRTPDLVQAFVECDGRVRLVPTPGNTGQAANFSRLVALARGDYFMWASHHDLWKPTFVSSCVRALEADHGAVLCYTGAELFSDREGQPPIRWPIDERVDVRSPKFSLVTAHRRLAPPPLIRLHALLRGVAESTPFYGLYRTSFLVSVVPLQPRWGFDWVVLVKAALRGSIVRVDEPLFLFNDEFYGKTDRQRWIGIHPDNARRRLILPQSHVLLDIIASVWRSPHRLPVRILLVADAIYCFLRLPHFRGEWLLLARTAWPWLRRELRRTTAATSERATP